MIEPLVLRVKNGEMSPYVASVVIDRHKQISSRFHPNLSPENWALALFSRVRIILEESLEAISSPPKITDTVADRGIVIFLCEWEPNVLRSADGWFYAPHLSLPREFLE